MSDLEFDSALTYTSYLAIDDLLRLQKPLSDGPEHDEMLFIIIHQSYELWFKQLIHEFNAAAQSLEAGDTHRSLALLGRIRTILKVCVTQVDILETMTPLQFNAFRGYLSSSSGFQSAQFRKVEALLGRRDSKMSSHLPIDVQAENSEEMTYKGLICLWYHLWLSGQRTVVIQIRGNSVQLACVYEHLEFSKCLLSNTMIFGLLNLFLFNTKAMFE